MTARPCVSFGAADHEQEGTVGALAAGDRVAAAPVDVVHGVSLRNQVATGYHTDDGV